jgi:hypothetical protein
MKLPTNNNYSFKTFLSFIALTFILASCGSSDTSSEETTFYKKESVSPKKLEVSIEASGVIEAISSVEIKSKASGEVLYLGTGWRFCRERLYAWTDRPEDTKKYIRSG